MPIDVDIIQLTHSTHQSAAGYLALFFLLFPFDMSVVENARGHAMRAALIALMLMLCSQSGPFNGGQQ